MLPNLIPKLRGSEVWRPRRESPGNGVARSARMRGRRRRESSGVRDEGHREGGPTPARLPALRGQQIQRIQHYCFRMLVATTRLKMAPEQSTRSHPTRLKTPFVMGPLLEVGEVTLTHELPMAFSTSMST